MLPSKTGAVFGCNKDLYGLYSTTKNENERLHCYEPRGQRAHGHTHKEYTEPGTFQKKASFVDVQYPKFHLSLDLLICYLSLPVTSEGTDLNITRIKQQRIEKCRESHGG